MKQKLKRNKTVPQVLSPNSFVKCGPSSYTSSSALLASSIATGTALQLYILPIVSTVKTDCCFTAAHVRVHCTEILNMESLLQMAGSRLLYTAPRFLSSTPLGISQTAVFAKE